MARADGDDGVESWVGWVDGGSERSVQTPGGDSAVDTCSHCQRSGIERIKCPVAERSVRDGLLSVV